MFASRLALLDTTLFAPIDSQTSADDKRSLLAIQRAVRSQGPFTYLEIGSHLGGTVQAYYTDPACQRIYSIDARPKFSPDIRGQKFHYPDNSSARMRKNLEDAYPDADRAKLLTFDFDAKDVDPTQIVPAPAVCFIDGEHTIPATLSDFAFCQRVAAPDAVFIFHDTNILFRAIEQIEADLTSRQVPHRGLLLAGCVYAILRGQAVARYERELSELAQDRARMFGVWQGYLAQAQQDNARSLTRRLQQALTRFPRVYDAVRAVRDRLMA